MTNLEKLVSGLGGMIVTMPREISGKTLAMIACPFEAVEDPDALEIDGCPSKDQCMACKGRWLAKEAEK